MKPDPRLHHYAQQIVSGSLEDVLEMYQLLNCKVVYRPKGDITWAMVGQEQLRFAIQIVEVNDEPIQDVEVKRRTHLAFLSDDPQKIIDIVKNWASSRKISFREGWWSEKEKFFDLPDIFINFVIEVMHTSIEEE